MHIQRITTILATAAALTSCNLIDYHPYDVHITGDTDVNANNIARIEAACNGKQQVQVAVIGDSHRWYDELKLFVEAINRRDDIDFVIHDGDLSEYGYTQEFLWTRDCLNGLKIPYVALIGNHDCLGTGRDTYRAVFGDTDFSFIAGRIKFICLNTNALEYDYSDPIPAATDVLHQRTRTFHSARRPDGRRHNLPPNRKPRQQALLAFHIQRRWNLQL